MLLIDGHCRVGVRVVFVQRPAGRVRIFIFYGSFGRQSQNQNLTELL